MADMITIQKGQTLFSQGEQPNALFMLQEGTLEILHAPGEFEGLDLSIIISRSTRVGLINGKAVLAGFSRLLDEPYLATVRALEPCQIAKYPLAPGGLRAISQNDINLTSTLLKNIFSRVSQAQNDLSKAAKLFQNVAMVNDNIHLVYKALAMSNAADPLVSNAERLHAAFTGKGGVLPRQIDMNFIISDNSRMLGARYDLPGYSAETMNVKIMNILKGIMKLPPSILPHVLKESPEIALYGFDFLTDTLEKSFKLLITARKEIDTRLKVLFNEEESWSRYLVNQKGYDEWLGSGRITPDFLKNFLTIVGKIDSFYSTLYGKSLEPLYPGIGKLKGIQADIQKSAAEEEKAAAVPAAGATGTASDAQLKRSMSQIFEFSLVDKEFQKNFIKVLSDFKALANPFDTDPDSRKLRRFITKMYWDLYKQVYVRSKSETTIPRVVNLMLNFGFLDDELLESGQLNSLNNISRQREHVPREWIVRETEFLDMVYTAKEEPSITEMGQNYRDYLRDQEKYGKGTDKSAGDDELLAKVLYEISQRLASTSSVCSGSTSTAFPILNSIAMRGDLENFYVSKRKIVEIIEEIKRLDFSAFYRETVLKMGEAREIIQEEIEPYFIELPIYGSRVLMWQELSGNNKRSRGRIVLPIFFMGDLKKGIAESFAAFRWELTRTIKGAMWGDPIEGGVTGEYFDYVNTYSKNSKLSPEAKLKIKERFKSLRSDRDKFTDDYITWLFYEHDGIMKMNSVVREMFFKHIPFPKETRERLEQMPAYTQMANRYKNLNARAIAAFDRKFKKYQDESGKLPPEIQQFMDFLEL